MQISGVQEFPHFENGEPVNMNYKYIVLGILVIFFPVVGSKSGSRPFRLPVFSFQCKTGSTGSLNILGLPSPALAHRVWPKALCRNRRA